MNNDVFKLMKKNLPGPFTFILNATSNLPKLFRNKKTVGIRVPDNNVIREIVRTLGNPILSTSVRDDNDESRKAMLEDPTGPSNLYTLGDGIFEVLRVEDAKATKYSMTADPVVIEA